MHDTIWDYHIGVGYLTILYPDGLTQLSTNDEKLIAEFMKVVGDAIECDYHLDVIIEEYAGTIERKARKPKSRVDVWKEEGNGS